MHIISGPIIENQPDIIEPDRYGRFRGLISTAIPLGAGIGGVLLEERNTALLSGN
jgi:hypothetical protein